MRFVHVIARLNEDMVKCDKVLDDLDDMAIEALGGAMPYSDSDKAMVALIVAVEQKVGADRSRFWSRIKGYEYRRDFRTEV